MADSTATGVATGAQHRPPAPAAPRLHAAVQRVGDVAALDPVAKRLAATVRGAAQPGALRDALSGRALGHALHPLLTDLPIGTWTSASLLDVIGGRHADRSARRLIGVGIAAALPRLPRVCSTGPTPSPPTTRCVGWVGSSTPSPTWPPSRCTARRSPRGGEERAAGAGCWAWPAPRHSGSAASSAGISPTRRRSASMRPRSARASTSGPMPGPPTRCERASRCAATSPGSTSCSCCGGRDPGARRPLRPSRRAPARGQRRGRVRHLPAAREPVPAGGRRRRARAVALPPADVHGARGRRTPRGVLRARGPAL